MKLRVSGDSLRLRLSPDEIARLRGQGQVSDAIRFGDGALSYGVLSRSDVKQVAVERTAETIAVLVPAGLVDEWTGTDRVGIEATVDNGATGLRVLLEKDWQCLTARASEDESHLYPNPAAGP